MRFFLIFTSIIYGIFGIIKNFIVKVFNGIISLHNKYVRKKKDQISRGVSEVKQSTIESLLSSVETDNTVISGGNGTIRAEWIAKLTKKAFNQGYPVLIIHEGNSQLYKTISSQFSNSDISFIDSNNPYFEPFYNYTSKEISKFLLDSSSNIYDIKKNAMYYIDGMCDFLKCKKIQPTLNAFNQCPHMQLFDKVDGLIINGIISDTQGQTIKSKLMMGQSEQVKIETLINDLFDEFEPILNKSKSNYKNIKSTLSTNKISVINVASSLNNLLIDFLMSQIKHAVTKGQQLVFITDGLSTASSEIFKKFLLEKSNKCKVVTCSDDVFSTCAGDDKIFGTLIGNTENVIILDHSSGATCTKWAETIGYYNKEEETRTIEKGHQRHSPFSLFSGSNTSSSKSYSIKREYIVKPEDINRMSHNEVYFYNHRINKLMHTYIKQI